MESVELEVLRLLEENARMSEEEIAEVLAVPVDRVKEIIKKVRG